MELEPELTEDEALTQVEGEDTDEDDFDPELEDAEDEDGIQND